MIGSGAGVRIERALAAIPADQWDACAGPDNPFVCHAFLSALEASGSVGPGTGWTPAHLTVRDDAGQLAGAMPLYAKDHSYGEYVFDHNWADAFSRAGGRYYPKLLGAVPFSPVPGPRVLCRDSVAQEQLLKHALGLPEAKDLSSLHVTFIDPGQVEAFAQAGFLIRTHQQFHWSNPGYRSFEDFLAALASRKRKMIRRERVQAVEAGIRIHRLTGAALETQHWDAFWRFYQATSARKWGSPYLTRSFFDLLGQTIADKVLLVLAERDGRWIAGALNLIGTQALFGRNWGCTEHHPFLHFELCYYQAIEAAIELGLKRVEAGAQGEHKLARGYLPVQTTSAHWIVDPGFRRAVAQYLERERAAVADQMVYLEGFAPFRKGVQSSDMED
jgi:uncharacterized protein